MRFRHIIFWSAIVFIVFIGIHSLREGRNWTSELPPEFKINQRLARGSTGTCGAVIYQLSRDQTEDLREMGISIFPAGLEGPDGRKYQAWAKTPMPADTFERYIMNSGVQRVGLECSHASWQQDWRDIAREPGNYYTANGEAVILLQVSILDRSAHNLASVGYFYNR